MHGAYTIKEPELGGGAWEGLIRDFRANRRLWDGRGV